MITNLNISSIVWDNQRRIAPPRLPSHHPNHPSYPFQARPATSLPAFRNLPLPHAIELAHFIDKLLLVIFVEENNSVYLMGMNKSS